MEVAQSRPGVHFPLGDVSEWARGANEAGVRGQPREDGKPILLKGSALSVQQPIGVSLPRLQLAYVSPVNTFPGCESIIKRRR